MYVKHSDAQCEVSVILTVLLSLHLVLLSKLHHFYNNIYIYTLLTSADVVQLMKTAGVVENSGHCIYFTGLKCF